MSEGIISVIIPVRDKEIWRLKEVIKRLKKDPVKEVIIVDYCSKKPIKINDKLVNVIRYNKKGAWNKAHAINIGAKRAKGSYLMTLDADILLTDDFWNKVVTVGPVGSSFIYSSKVKRIEREHIGTDEEMIKKCTPWYPQSNYFIEMNHTGTGGVQLFPKAWFEKMRGIDENLVYYGGMDNITLCDAKRYGLNLVSLSTYIFHIEHKDKKEDNFKDEYERELAKFIKQDRPNLLNRMLSSNEPYNPGFWGDLTKPNCPILQEYKEVFDPLYEKAKKQERVDIPYEQNTRILITPITNRPDYPIYFSESLHGLYEYTKAIFPNTEILNITACDVNHMRNIAVDRAIQGGYDVLIQLDIDHKYPRDFILRLMRHGKKFITGLTMNRSNPFHLTQYKKILDKTAVDSNLVKADGKLHKIEATGVVGMLMDVATLRTLPRPWFKMTYAGEIGQKVDRGGDFNFCKLLKDFEIPIYCDTSIEFPHHTEAEVRKSGLLLPGDMRVHNWEQKHKKHIITEFPKVPKDL